MQENVALCSVVVIYNGTVLALKKQTQPPTETSLTCLWNFHYNKPGFYLKINRFMQLLHKITEFLVLRAINTSSGDKILENLETGPRQKEALK